MTHHRVLSGIRATGRLHLGNYLGAVKGMLALQDDPDYQTLYMVADAHAMTTPYNAVELRQNRREVILDYLACGLDPQKSVIFQQAEVIEHFELAFYLSSVTTIAKMQHLPTFKDKVKQYPQHSTMALLNYPILMAADILIYKADRVPIGVDQEPHLEVAREIARRMNAEYDTNFPEPKSFATAGAYVPSLQGAGKMSKSTEGSYINLTDSEDQILKALSRAPTDSGQGAVVPAEGGVANLLTFVALFQGEPSRGEYESMYLGGGIRYGELKRELASAIADELRPIQARRAALEADTEFVDEVIKEGAAEARVIAQETMRDVKEKMGLG